MSIPGPADPPPPASSLSDSTADARTLATWPLLVWLLAQLAALLLAAARVPMAADYPRAAERLAVYLLLATQIVAAAALMPWLLRGWRSSVLAAACCWPLLAVAVVLSALPRAQALAAGAFLTAWVAGLAACRAAAPSHRAAYVISAVASAVAAGGPLLWYLRVEFVSGDTSVAGQAWQYGPVLSAFTLASGGAPSSGTTWLAPLTAVVVGVPLGWIARWRTSRARRRQPDPFDPPLSPTGAPLASK